MTDLLTSWHEITKIFSSPLCEMHWGQVAAQVYASIGLTIIITQSKLFKPLRDWLISKWAKLEYLVECPLCMGFWCGVFMYFQMDNGLLTFALIASISSFLVWSIYEKFLKNE